MACARRDQVHEHSRVNQMVFHDEVDVTVDVGELEMGYVVDQHQEHSKWRTDPHKAPGHKRQTDERVPPFHQEIRIRNDIRRSKPREELMECLGMRQKRLLL